ncbi:uncharacterized protein N7511_011337 [Penicillium nucicola]|uniref:uncharacterized protein n=1 Tax=Penicillium nucicola TaxID=1850975 RepID=UPI0025451874|nr:uncharacterized protein N7511_011317 [Penicillium nucicola]XP_056978671.1 uncharacterized protein N7511_011337 [Penicillium nucicola]KAJ5742585.1 hypothetical protein N7511_011317 [Penicillium nucicola]KAJ5742605.1 hypothetical protein N7511_011337 [Penicillium nucicola]
MEHQLFHQPSTDPVIVCQRCEHGIRPKQVVAHLQGTHHRLSLARARLVSETIQNWDRIEECEQWEPPSVISTPIPNLPIYSDGLLCTKIPLCSFIGRTVKTIRQHWRDHHSWTAPVNNVGGGRKQPGPSAAEQQIRQFTQVVRCQRAFGQGPGSHYIRVRTGGVEPVPKPIAPTVLGDQVLDQIEQAFTERQSQPQTIQASQRDEANPWLRRTQWAVYLRGINPQDLRDSVQAPNANSAISAEKAASAIWDSMAVIARISQLICTKTSQSIRTEAVRTERDRLPHQPLQAYMDAENIDRHTLPWQQILMFFARTQATHEWNSPKYRFSKRQRAAWIWRLAQSGVDTSPRRSDRASSAGSSEQSASSEYSKSDTELRLTEEQV